MFIRDGRGTRRGTRGLDTISDLTVFWPLSVDRNALGSRHRRRSNAQAQSRKSMLVTHNGRAQRSLASIPVLRTIYFLSRSSLPHSSSFLIHVIRRSHRTPSISTDLVTVSHPTLLGCTPLVISWECLHWYSPKRWRIDENLYPFHPRQVSNRPKSSCK